MVEFRWIFYADYMKLHWYMYFVYEQIGYKSIDR